MLISTLAGSVCVCARRWREAFLRVLVLGGIIGEPRSGEIFFSNKIYLHTRGTYYRIIGIWDYIPWRFQGKFKFLNRIIYFLKDFIITWLKIYLILFVKIYYNINIRYLYRSLCLYFIQICYSLKKYLYIYM